MPLGKEGKESALITYMVFLLCSAALAVTLAPTSIDNINLSNNFDDVNLSSFNVNLTVIVYWNDDHKFLKILCVPSVAVYIIIYKKYTL